MGLSPGFVLASSSPRRRDLLREAGFVFTVVSPEVEEPEKPQLTAREVTALHATRKALAVARSRPNDAVLGCDTIVLLDGRVIGKPADLEEAAEFLRQLSGRAHEVVSTVTLFHLAKKRSILFHEVSRVHFRALNSDAIQSYFQRVNPLDKAGAYAAQGDKGEIIEKIEGSRTNVIGLPMEQTVEALAQFGIRPAPA